MKKLALLLIFILTIFQGISQTKGISYQAVILNPEAQEIPGVNAEGNILANTTVGIQFTIIDASGNQEYQESHTTSTDNYGMLNLLIGAGNPSSSTGFSEILWDGTTKRLKVAIDFSGGSNYSPLSEQNLTYMPQPPTEQVSAAIETNAEAITNEIIRATAAEELNAEDLAAEVLRATTAEGVIQSDVDANQAASELADATLTTDLAAEVLRATTAEGVIQSDVDANQVASELADATLTTDLATEVSRATTAEGVIQSDVDANQVASELADATLTTDLAAEVLRATTAEGVIQSDVDANQVASELADATLTTDLAAEVLRATTAEGVNATAISALQAEQITQNTAIAANTATIGEIKQTIALSMPSGWVKLDGAAISSLTSTQQTEAANLGLVGNLPNATNAYLSQNGGTLGSVSGSNSKTIAQNNLPNVTLSGTANSAGNHRHYIYGNTSDDLSAAGGNSDYVLSNYDGSGVGEYTAAAGAHTHTVTTSSINGGVTQQAMDITPTTLSVNTYIYLGL
ncbi:hypothetical protein [Lutibacter sp.]|uniref:hypothetical protein n=1 Tax=Lutibacter sp. TaxID=1925666 RepID=UPI0025B8F508|nr:hypothetical protein [Lutibacter sp.]MCF6167419.1 hypothetical protein [Lutibacter sp.]